MRKHILLIIGVLWPIFTLAQVMDDSAIDQLQKGNYSIEKGKIQVVFDDTTSQKFAVKELERRGYDVLESTFQNIVLSIENDPRSGQLAEIEEHEWVDFILSESSGISDESLEEINDKDTLDNAKINQILSQINRKNTGYEFITVGLKPTASMSVLEDLKTAHPNLEFRVAENSIRSAVIQTEEGKEEETIQNLKALPFIVDLTYIGSLKP